MSTAVPAIAAPGTGVEAVQPRQLEIPIHTNSDCNINIYA